MRSCAWFAALLGIFTACGAAETREPQSRPATTRAGATSSAGARGSTAAAGATATSTQPAALRATAEVEALLERIEARHDSVKTLESPLIYDRNQIVLNDKQRRFGKLIYVAGPPPKFAIHFDKVLINRARSDQDRWYVFDGRYFVERLHDRKQFFRRELVAADKVHTKDPMSMGKSPLLVPLPLRKDDLLRRYEISIAPQAPTDPPGTVHLTMLPRPKPDRTDQNASDLWIDKTSLLPVKARTVDNSRYESVVTLKKTVINGTVDQKVIDTSLPTEEGWQVEDVPLRSDGEGSMPPTGTTSNDAASPAS